jgi:electron transfer flavoprotein alpha subunit
MSAGVLVVGELGKDGPRPGTAELIGAGSALSEAGAGPLAVALIGAEAESQAGALDLAGVEEVLAVPSPVAHFEPHVSQAALEALIEARAPAVVLAGHTIDSLGFVPAVAARGGHGFAGEVTGLSWDGGAVRARRGAFGDRLAAELEFPGKETVLLMLREGSFEPAPPGGSATVSTVELDLVGAARTEQVERREPPAADVDIAAAEVLLSIGRGVEDEESIPELERLAEKMGATLSASRPLVDAGWVPSARQVGQSGKTVTPKVYLALGISGAVQHVAGIANAKTIIAVNSDPEAPIFAVADYGAVADLFDVAAELERQFE